MTAARAATALALTVIVTACPGDAGDAPAPADRGAAPPGESFRPMVEEVLPSIVFIQAEASIPPGFARIHPGIEEVPDEPVPVGVGSGVIYSDDGYILTNNHVVQEADRVMVVLNDRRYFEAEVVGRDPSTEVAVVRIDGNGYEPAVLGDSDALGIGDWVLAMGSPLGLEFSVTAGIISGTGRAIGILGGQAQAREGAPPLEHFIQTDAALSPGNSGGPLVNAAGEVIGINTAVAAGPGGGGVGFAIPSNLARRVADQLIRDGVVRRAYLGVMLANLDPALAREHGLETVEGAAVLGVEPGGPAADAGLEEGDVILGVEGEEVQTVSDLQARLLELDPGTTATLRVVRGGEEREIRVRLGEQRYSAAD